MKIQKARTYIVKDNDFSEFENDANIVFNKEDKNGTRHYYYTKCQKCGGTGFIGYYMHVEGGRCFECGGSGISYTDITVMTEEYAEKLEARRIAKLKKESAARNEKFLRKEGFSEDGFAWIVLGNTYDIKEELKAAGARYCDTLGWHFNKEQSEYETAKISITDDVYGYPLVEADEQTGIYSYSAGKYEIDNWLKEVKGRRVAELKAEKGEGVEYFGEKGDKISVSVELVKYASFESRYTYYGETNYIYTFTDGKHIFTWKTQSVFPDDIAEGKITLKGTIKDHKEFRGEKQTVLTRCKIAA